MNEPLPETLQDPDELKAMIDLYQARSPRRVLEIGVWHGGTLRQWLTAGNPETVVAVDLEHWNFAAYGQWGVEPLTTIYGNSQDDHVIEAMRLHGPYDWIFVDGDHDYTAVRTDVLNSLLMIEPGGALLIHDIAAPNTAAHPVYPPGAVFNALANLYPHDRFVKLGPSVVPHGIGVLYV